MPKIFLSDSNIFSKDCHQRVERAAALCAQYGFDCFHPLRSNFHAQAGMAPPQMAAAICQNNLKELDACDILLAQLDPFRGHEPDSGAVFECGYMFAKGKPVYGYVADTQKSYCQRYPVKTFDREDGVYRDEQGRRIEEFSLPVNLMLGVPVHIVTGGIEDALRQIAAEWKAQGIDGNADCVK